MKNNYIGPALIIVFFIFLFTVTRKPSLENIKEVRIAGQNIKVDLALTSEAQVQGLSGRQGLNENEGMLFVFSARGAAPAGFGGQGSASGGDKAPRFWMKNMNFSIDMIWIAENGKIVYIKKDAQPKSYPNTYGPDQDTKYVLEVVSGFADKNNLQEGDKVLFTY